MFSLSFSVVAFLYIATNFAEVVSFPVLAKPLTNVAKLDSSIGLSAGQFKAKSTINVEDIVERVKTPVLTLMLSACMVLPAQAFDASVFTNDYADPLHPLCKRHIEVSRDGKTFHYSGTAVGPKGDPVLRGCSAEEIRKYKLRYGSFDGEIIGDKVSAGDGIHEGVWEPAGVAATNIGYEDVDGIRWNDGNKWIVKEKSLATKAAEVFFYSYIGFSSLAGVKGIYELIQRRRETA